MHGQSVTALVSRTFAWFTVAATLVFLIGNVLVFGFGMPGLVDMGRTSGNPQVWMSVGAYVVCLVAAFVYASRLAGQPLRTDAQQITDIVTFLIRASFWSVLLVGLTDAILSFLRVEGLLPAIVGDQLAQDLGRSRFRGPYVHLPLIALAILIAAVTRGLGFIWLALLVVLAELGIVISRFVFSYEQAFQADLVRFWYAALFLFASAYTLTEEGHVRVDVFYASMTQRTRGYVNLIG
ncbi:MAG: TRAP transporter small permease subunit, partial [Pseudomonadota bacterium]